MPTPTAEDIVRAALEGLARRDLEAWLGMHAPDCELVTLRQQIADAGESYQGHDGLRAWWADSNELWDELRFDNQRVETVGDGVILVVADLYARPKDGGTELRQREVAWLLRVTGGAIGSSRQYWDVAAALDALGLLPD